MGVEVVEEVEAVEAVVGGAVGEGGIHLWSLRLDEVAVSTCVSGTITSILARNSIVPGISVGSFGVVYILKHFSGTLLSVT